MLATHYGGRSDQNAQRNVTLPVTGQLPKPKADSDPFSPSGFHPRSAASPRFRPGRHWLSAEEYRRE
jgi:hypothetical protein